MHFVYTRKRLPNFSKNRFFKFFVFAWALLHFSMVGLTQQANASHLADHKPFMNLVWDTFNQLMYKVGKTDGKASYTPYFPERLARLNGRTVTIKGYMVPIGTGRRHNIFLLSVLPVNQCMFCGQNGIPPMVEITLAKNEKLLFSENPIAIKGTVFLNGSDETRAEIQLREAYVQ